MNGKVATLAQIEERVITEGIRIMDAQSLARHLGVSKSKMYRKLQQYGIPLKLRRTGKAREAAVERLIQRALEARTFLGMSSEPDAQRTAAELHASLQPFLESDGH